MAQCPMERLQSSGCPVSARALSFDAFDPAYQQNPAEFLRWAREQEPVFYSPQLRHWVITRYEDVKTVFRDNILFSPANVLDKITPSTSEVNAILARYGFAMKRTMVNEDEPEHMPRRRLLMDAFMPERLVHFEPMVRGLTRDAMDKFVATGRADLVKEIFHEIPLIVALKFLGVRDEDAAQLKQFAAAHVLNTWGRPSPQEQVEIAETVGKFWQAAQRILDRMMAQPDGQGWMYESIRQHRLRPDVVPESYLRSMMMAILAAAHETTSNASANAFMMLLRERSAWDTLCRNPALIPNAVEECLRVAGSAIAWRRVTTADAVVGGIAIPKGSQLLLMQASANADPRHFENPDELDVYRDSAAEHLTFGYGAHQCMGKNLGRMQMRVFIEEFVRRLPHMHLAPGQRFEFRPNISFRGPLALWVEWNPALNPEARDPRLKCIEPEDFYVGPPPRDSITREVVVDRKVDEGEGLVRLVLMDPDGGPVPAWSAGAHVDLISAGFRRKYSLCGRAGERSRLEVVIQREAQGRGGSRHFCDVVQPGARIRLAGPRNTFVLDESARHWVLIAGGIGITPIVAMADRLAELGKSYELHYAGRQRSRMALLPRLLEHHGQRLHMHVGEEGGRIDLRGMFAHQPDATTRVYACGPERLLTELESLAQTWPQGVLRFEHFHAGAAALDPSKEHAFHVELSDSKLSFVVPADQSLIQVLHARGIDVPWDCGEGLCGTCEVTIVDGQADHRDKVLSRVERSEHRRMMACCSRAAGDRIVIAL